MAKTRQVVGEQAEADGESDESTGDEVTVASAVQRVLIKQSPYLDAFHEHLPVRLTIDSGATGNMMKASCGHSPVACPNLATGCVRKIRVPNLTNVPQLVQKSHQLCRVRAVCPPISDATVLADPPRPVSTTRSSLSSDLVALDPDDIMPSDVKDKFRALHREFDEVFDPQFKGYNGAVGPFQAKVNMGLSNPLNARAGSHSTPGVSYKNFRHSLTCWRG
ncbi:hypothetical protein AAFF_G00077380 [Aldrovandia affinis]|uniref:Uncharacterized protein n=1 Tax=Aldrovandia affinis TaxID=143900 RepID=A0AAD7R270_9TELE|nr:hypothetical protein AAFF_G00077380 [Aldrovandia affinis]